MADVVVQKSALFSGGKNQFITIALATAEGQPLPENTPPLQLSIGADVAKPVKFGAADEAKLSISADATAALTPIFNATTDANAKLLQTIGASGFFTGQHADQMLLLLELGASANVDLTASPQRLAPIAGAVELKAGVDASYRYARSFPKITPAKDLLSGFFTDLKVPAALNRPLHADEILIFEFGGAASFGLSASVGYKLAGSRAFSLGDLALSETYAFSLLGKVSLNAEFAGRFNIEVRPAEQDAAQGWAHVRVERADKRAFGIAAELDAGAKFATAGLPATANEFLEATLGLRAKNWLAYFKRAQELTDPDQVKALLDRLADGFIDKWLGKAFRALETEEALAFFAKIKAALDSYDKLGDRVVTLFDRFYDPIAGAVTPLLQQVLDQIAQIQNLAELKGKVLDGPLAEALEILTDGKLLDFLEGGEAKLAELKAEVAKALALVKTDIPNAAHKELRDLIATAKKEFGFDKLANLLRNADPAKLKTIADDRITGFAERLIGRTVDEIADSAVGKAAKEINDILSGIEKFKNTFYAKLLDAVKQSFSLSLHAGYNAARESDNLIECDVNLNTAAGLGLIAQAGRGKFADLLTTTDPGVVRNLDGTLRRTMSRKTTVSINLTGWHDHSWKYQSIREMVVNAEQHVQSTASGLAVTTDLSLSLSADKRRNGERLMTSFVLDVVGMSKAGAPLDPKTKMFLVDRVGAMSASYALVREDPSTTPAELKTYLGLAGELGFDLGADPDTAINRLLPQKNGSFGNVTVTYDVKFTDAGLNAIFSNPVDSLGVWQQQLRRTMRNLVLANYLGQPGLHHLVMGWAYWSDATFTKWLAAGGNATKFIAPASGKQAFAVVGNSPLHGVPRPDSVLLDAGERRILDTLFRIEKATVEAFSDLLALKGPFDPVAYQKALAKFGAALDLYDRFDDGDNTILAIFDALIERSGVAHARNSQLTIKGTLDKGTDAERTVTKVLLA